MFVDDSIYRLMQIAIALLFIWAMTISILYYNIKHKKASFSYPVRYASEQNSWS